MTAQDLPPEDPGSDGPVAAGGPTPVDWGVFVFHAVRRRWAVSAGVLVACLAVLVTYYRMKTPLYRVETTILAQRQQALPSMVRPNVVEDSPTRSAWELIHRRENLLALIHQAGLDAAPATASQEGEAVDRLVVSLKRMMDPRLSSSDPMDTLVLIIDRALQVSTVEGTITIAIDWPNPDQGYRLVEGALQNFLEARHLQEVTALDEAISLLQGRAAVAQNEAAKVAEEARRAALQSASRAPRTSPLPAAGSPPWPQSEELARLRSILEAKERAIGDVEEFRRRRLADLQAQYDAKRAVYSDMHPEIVSLRHDIAALSRDSPQVAGLREEERKLRLEYDARLAKEAPAGAASAAAAGSASRPSPEGVSAAVEQNERVREARFRAQQLTDRVSAAQVELDTARAAFKYRYTVVWPAQLPTRPVSPNARKIFGLGGIASLLLAVLAAAAAEVRAGRVVERWQVERGLRLPILGEVGRE